jgi:hypothetical protein
MRILRIAAASLALMAIIGMGAAAAPSDIAGSWVGSIESDHGEMQVALRLADKDGKLEGLLKTAHGDWPVLSVSEKSGAWTILLKVEGGNGRMAGRIKDGAFTGEWDNAPMATGTFALKRPK